MRLISTALAAMLLGPLAVTAVGQISPAPPCPAPIGPPTVIELDDQDFVVAWNTTYTLTNHTIIRVYGGSILVEGIINGGGQDGAHGTPGFWGGPAATGGQKGCGSFDLTLESLPSRMTLTPAGGVHISGGVNLRGGNGGYSGAGATGGYRWVCPGPNQQYPVLHYPDYASPGGDGGRGGNLTINTAGPFQLTGYIDASGGSGGGGGDGGGWGATALPVGGQARDGGWGGVPANGGAVTITQLTGTPDRPHTPDFVISHTAWIQSNGGDGGRGGNGGSGGASGGFAGGGRGGASGGPISIASVTDLAVAGAILANGGRGGAGGHGGGGASATCEGCGEPTAGSAGLCGGPAEGPLPCPGSVGRRGGKAGWGGNGGAIQIKLTAPSSEVVYLTSLAMSVNGGLGGTAGNTAPSGYSGGCPCAGNPSTPSQPGEPAGSGGQISVTGPVLRIGYAPNGGVAAHARGGNGGGGGLGGLAAICAPPCPHGEQGGAGGPGGKGGAVKFSASAIHLGSLDLDVCGGDGGPGGTGQPYHGLGGVGGLPGSQGSYALNGTILYDPGYALTICGAPGATGAAGPQGGECFDG